MQYLVLGFGTLAILLLLARWFVKAPAHLLARRLRTIGGIVALIIAVVLALLGRIALAAPLAGFALMLLTRTGPFGGGKPTSGQTSSVQTAWFAMELDHDSGAMRGKVLKGRFSGRSLDDLGEADLFVLAGECVADDPQSAQLLEAYLDRRMPDWRERASAHPGAAPGSGPMTTEEAWAILGLEPGASEAQIRDAHRRLIKKVHPDQGGSTYLASKLNDAKELLLSGG